MQLMAGRARAAAHYPAKFCRALCKGMKRQARVDASGMLSTLILEGGWDEVSEVTHIAEPWMRYWDDISGTELKPELVRAAREEELKVSDEMAVWVLLVTCTAQRMRPGKLSPIRHNDIWPRVLWTAHNSSIPVMRVCTPWSCLGVPVSHTISAAGS